MHYWGDKGVDWQGINDAAEFIGRNLHMLTRLKLVNYKEKYGTVTVDCNICTSWQKFIYRLLYRLALKKWPHLWKEIMSDCDWPEYLKGLIDPAKCDHSHFWSSEHTARCAFCMTEIRKCDMRMEH